MPETNISLLSLKDLSEPATKLIEAVKDAIGVLYEPTHVRRMAKAEVDATLIKKEGEAKVEELARRASERIQNRELRRQQNIESIVATALEQLPSSVSNEPVDDDWVSQFFEQCQDVGNTEMQTLWAKLLAGEIAEPGTYSRRTLNLVRLMSMDDASLFTKFCSYIFHGDEFLFHIRLRQSDQYLLTKGFSYRNLLNLQNVGLIESGDIEICASKEKPFYLSYFEERLKLGIPKHYNLDSRGIGATVLSKTGQELAPICGASPDVGYIAALNEGLRELNLFCGGINDPEFD
jgi:uncharacterized repeat protein (TIGR03899 family)